jgi:hypothetical protein
MILRTNEESLEGCGPPNLPEYAKSAGKPRRLSGVCNGEVIYTPTLRGLILRYPICVFSCWNFCLAAWISGPGAFLVWYQPIWLIRSYTLY